MSKNTQQHRDGESTPAEVSHAVEQLEQIGSEVETTQLGNGTVSVDFGLYKRTKVQTLVAQAAEDNSIKRLRESGQMTEEMEEALAEVNADVERRGGKKLEEAEGNVSDFENLPTQRTGGLYKSSVILSGDTVVEYNLRFPPVPAAHYRKPNVYKKLQQMCRQARSQVSDSRRLHADLKVRDENGGEERRKQVNRELRRQGISPTDKYWMPHILARDCSIPFADMMEFIRYLMQVFERRLPEANEWAVPDGERSSVSDDEGLDALAHAGSGFLIVALDDGKEVQFTIPNATEVSTIRVRNGKVLEYELEFAPCDTSKYGKILLQKAFEYLARERGLLADGECTLAIVGGAYVPQIESLDCSRPLGDVAQEIATVIESDETIEQRSRLS